MIYTVIGRGRAFVRRPNSSQFVTELPKCATNKEKYFNSLVILNHKLEILSIYNKINLVPFGEFLPFEKTLKSIGVKKITRGYNSFSPGELRSLINLGNEFGTVTGRKRRCGWLDLVLLKQSVIISGLKGLALTKLDVLDSFDIIRVCTSYKYNNKAYNYLPLGLDDLNQLSTEYIELNGWKEKTEIWVSDQLPLFWNMAGF